MKLLKVFLISVISIFLTSFSNIKSTNATLFLLAPQKDRLVEKNVTILSSDNSDMAKKIIYRLSAMQSTKRYAEFLPSDIKVYVKDKTAVVDLPKETEVSYYPIYSIVNSLTSGGEIITVKFICDDNLYDRFLPLVDLQETFVPDYNICS